MAQRGAAVRITYDEATRRRTLDERGVDFADAGMVFEGHTLTVEDDRFDYGEKRYQSMGMLGDRLVMVVWTPRKDARHVISMRKCNEREQRRYQTQLG
jgi:uncharacterized DUF497 family protein